MAPRPLNIVQIISSSATSGAERHVLVLAQKLTERGHKVTVICPPGWLADEVEKVGLPLLRSTLRKSQWLPTVGFLLKAARRKELDLVHTHLTRAAYLAFVASAFGRFPVVTSVHVYNDDPIYVKLAKAKNRIVAVSNFLKEKLIARGVSAKHLQTVYNGTDLYLLPKADVPLMKQTLGLPVGAQLVGHVGRVCQEKGHTELLTAWPKVVAAVPDAHLLLVGRVEEHYKEELETLLTTGGIKDSVSVLGIRHDVSALLDCLHVSTLPSHIEMLPYSAIEAMARSRPMVASKMGGLPEVVDDSKTGLLVDLDPDQIADALIKLLKNPTLASEMGTAGLEKVKRLFSLEKMVDELETVYRETQAT